jgi:hypothetical protein
MRRRAAATRRRVAAAVRRSLVADEAARTALNLLKTEVDAYAGRLGPYANGIWETQDTACWACDQGGPATAAAIVYTLTGRARAPLRRAAEGTIDTAISTRQRADGAFSGPAGDSESPDVATMVFGIEEANTYLELSPLLSAAQRDRWRTSVAAAADYLIANGNVTWYTNGNINLGDAEFFYLAWLVTGRHLFRGAYEQALGFALHPPQGRWPGRGLVVVEPPQRADGSDGVGYLTETGVGGTGFDPEYTELQLDVASRLYLVSRDPRVLRLANMLVNMLLPRIDPAFMLDASGGTRHPEPDREVPLITSAFAVLGLYGGRADLLGLILPQLRELAATYAQPANDYGNVYRRALGNDVAVIALATAAPDWAFEARRPISGAADR